MRHIFDVAYYALLCLLEISFGVAVVIALFSALFA